MPVEFLTKKEFEKFKTNDFKHLYDKCVRMFGKISRIEGILYVLVPLMIATLILTIEVLKNGG